MARSIAAVIFLGLAFAAAGAARSASLPEVRIARWHGDRKAAVSMRFDDNMASHLEIVIPLLDRYGFRGTFMVSPGTSRFRDKEQKWRDARRSGHELGNHTMHHEGAKDAAEAEYEIGETARILRSYDPPARGLMLFASGGGKSWGGTSWSRAGRAFKVLLEKHRLVDLYDGTHRTTATEGGRRAGDLLAEIDKSMEHGGRTMLVFHNVGTPTFRDRLRKLIKGRDLSFRADEFAAFVEKLHARKKELWIAPLLETIKYEREFAASKIEIRDRGDEIEIGLAVTTAPALYDQRLSLVVPRREGLFRVTQDGETVDETINRGDEVIAQVRPVTSTILVRYGGAVTESRQVRQ